MIDPRMERLMDYRIDVTARGSAKIYKKKKIHPMKKNVYYRKMQIVRWPNMDGHPDYEALAAMKKDMISKPDSSDWIRRDEHEDKITKTRKKAEKETRNAIIQKLADADVPNQDIAAGVGLSPGSVSQIKG